jgi:hypothetical protein
MPYVMMPVPEEHVEAVMNFILRAIARASIEPWDAESVNKIFAEVDEASRSLLAFVARDSVEGSELDAAEEARKVQLTVREVVGIMNELNTVTRESNRPNLLNSRMVSERMANGRTKERRVLQMDAEIAEFVRAAERAELQSAADPLGGAGE